MSAQENAVGSRGEVMLLMRGSGLVLQHLVFHMNSPFIEQWWR